MLSTFYVLRALAEEWNASLTGSPVADAYSQHPGELSVEISGAAAVTLRARLTGPLRFVITDPRSARARRNVATVLDAARGRTVTGVRVAERDRILYLDLSDGCLALTLFGGRANAMIIDEAGNVVDRFRSVGGDGAPVPRPAPQPAALVERAATAMEENPDSPSTAAKLVRTLNPLMNKLLAAECVFRAGCDHVADRAELTHLANTVAEVDTAAMEAAQPTVYWKGARPVAMSVISLQHLSHLRAETFDTVAEAARVFVKRALAWVRYDQEVAPVRSSATRARDKQEVRVKAIRRELASPSRADEYERFGHILMASPGAQIPPGESGDRVEMSVPDPFDENRPTQIVVSPGMSIIENAQRYYEKARASRVSREQAERRVQSMEAQLAELQKAVDALESATDPESWRALKKEAPDLVEQALIGRADVRPLIPFRRYDLGGGYEVWVGRNAKQNDELTTRSARKFDLWLHARGVPGSHVVLRRPTRAGAVPDHYVERAAEIAAYHSKARGSALVPVIVAERKYVRKPRGATPGTVVVDRQRVVIVEPGIPKDT